MKKTFLILLLISSVLQLKSQQIKASLDSNVIDFANQTYLKITVNANKGDIIIFPEFKDTIGNFVEIVENLKTDTISNNPFTVQKSYLITSFEDSIHTIPALPVIVNNDTLYSNPIKLYVNSFKIDSTKTAQIDTNQVIRIFDIKEQLKAPFSFKEFWMRYGKFVIILIILAVLIPLIVWLIKKLKRKEPIVVISKPQEPAHLIALKKLKELKDKELYQQGKIKEYYSELTEILRSYIELRYNVPALERTSSEILTDFRKLKLISDNLWDQLKKILNVADLAKFAKFNPKPETNEANFELTENFVLQTKLEIVAEKQTEVSNNNQSN